MINLAIFLIMFNFSFFSGVNVMSGVSLEGLKYLPVLYIAIIYLAISFRFIRKYRINHDFRVVKIYILLVAISLSYSMSTEYTFRSLVPWIAIYLIMFIIDENSACHRSRYENVFLKIAIFCMIISGINVCIGVYSGEAFVLDDSGVTRVGFLQTLPYWYAHSIAMIGFVYYYKGRFQSKIYLLIPIIVAAFFIAFGVRTYILAFVLAIFIVEALYVVKSKLKTFCLIVFTMLFLGILIFVYEPIRTKMFIVQSSSPIELLKNVRLSDRDRIAAYLISKSYEYSGLISGTGAGTAKYLLEKEKAFDNTLVSHSDYTRVVTEFGLPGLLLYVSLMILWFRKAIKALAITKPDGRHYACAYASSISFIAIGGLAYDLFAPVSVFTTYMLYFISTEKKDTLGVNQLPLVAYK